MSKTEYFMVKFEDPLGEDIYIGAYDLMVSLQNIYPGLAIYTEKAKERPIRGGPGMRVRLFLDVDVLSKESLTNYVKKHLEDWGFTEDEELTLIEMVYESLVFNNCHALEIINHDGYIYGDHS